MNYRLIPVTEQILKNARDLWETQISDLVDNGQDVPIQEHMNVLNSCKEHEDNGQASVKVFSYALLNDNDECVAICSVSWAMSQARDSWLKVLGITLSPRLASEPYLDEYMTEFPNIAAHIIVGTLGLTYGKHRSNELKIYTPSDSPLDVGFFRGIAQTLQGSIPEISVSSHGKWFVIRKN